MILEKSHIRAFDVPFDEIDEAGVVYHSHYLTLCDRVRNRLLTEIGIGYEFQFEKDIAFAVAECHARYLKPVKLGEYYMVSRLVSASRSSLLVKQAISPEKPDSTKLETLKEAIEKIDSCFFYADFHLVAFSISKKQAIPIPPDMRAKMKLD